MSAPRQSSLFDEPPPTRIVEVLERAKPADKAQAAFQRLVAQIEQQRAVLLDWQHYRERYNQRLSTELTPLEKEFAAAQRRMVFLLDELLGQSGGAKGKRLRSKLQRLVIDIAKALLVEGGDAEIEAIHDKYSEISHAESQEISMALARDVIEETLGVRLDGAHDARSMDDLIDLAAREMRARDEKEQCNAGTGPEERRKSRKAQEADARREEAAREVSQSVREVYRKLASALHPDRETDADLRRRKTEQMQRVNQAYQAGDLLALLNLQLEIEQIDAEHLATLSAQRLSHYIHVLREQLDELKGEIESLVAPFRNVLADPFAPAVSPKQVDRALDKDIAQLKRQIEEIKTDLVDFRDPRKLKAAMENYGSEREMDDLSDLDVMDELAELTLLMGAFSPPPPPRKQGGKKRRR